MGFKVQGLSVGVEGLGVGVEGVGCRVQCERCLSEYLLFFVFALVTGLGRSLDLKQSDRVIQASISLKYGPA